MYACGHSVCSHCMRTSDEYTSSPFIHSLTIYKCPVCRSETLVPWHRRPANVDLRKICERHSNFMSRLVEVGPDKKADRPKCGVSEDLSKLAFQQQQRIAHEIYAMLLPQLHDAALEGRSVVCVNDADSVKKIQRVGETLGELMFRRHNVCKMTVTSTDVTFHFLNTTFSLRAERQNRMWNDPITHALEELRAHGAEIDEQEATEAAEAAESFAEQDVEAGRERERGERTARTSYEESYSTPWHTRNRRAIRATRGLGTDPSTADLTPPTL